MPSSSKTAHGLNLWSAEDHPQRTDFVSDNQKIDDLFSQHIADTALHKTASDKTSLTMGTYKGNNEDMQLVSLPFAPQVLLIYPQNQSPIQKDAAEIWFYTREQSAGLCTVTVYICRAAALPCRTTIRTVYIPN